MTQPDSVNFDRPVDRHPWLAVNLSMIMPGLGQLYAGRWGQGLLFALGQVSLVTIVAWSFFSANGNTLVGFMLLTPAAFVYIASLFEAYRDISGVSILSAAQHVSHTPDLWFAMFLCQVIPGLGQFYLHQTNLGTVLIIVNLGLAAAATLMPSLVLIVATLAALTCYHAYRTAPAVRNWRKELSYLIALTLVIFGLRFLLGSLPVWIGNTIQPFEIPSESMLPTLHKGDRILVHKSATYRPKPGELIVFQVAEADAVTGINRTKFFVKRVIATPGQTVEVRQGIVFRNQQPTAEPYIAEPPAYELPLARVPEQYYFVLGDNRNDSFDSHVWGFLPYSSIVGKAYKIYLPFDRVKPL